MKWIDSELCRDDLISNWAVRTGCWFVVQCTYWNRSAVSKCQLYCFRAVPRKTKLRQNHTLENCRLKFSSEKELKSSKSTPLKEQRYEIKARNIFSSSFKSMACPETDLWLYFLLYLYIQTCLVKYVPTKCSYWNRSGVSKCCASAEPPFYLDWNQPMASLFPICIKNNTQSTRVPKPAWINK